MSETFYKVIDGVRYDRRMLEVCDKIAQQNYFITLHTASLLNELGCNFSGIPTRTTIDTLKYIRDNYKSTDAFNAWVDMKIEDYRKGVPLDESVNESLTYISGHPYLKKMIDAASSSKRVEIETIPRIEEECVKMDDNTINLQLLTWQYIYNHFNVQSDARELIRANINKLKRKIKGIEEESKEEEGVEEGVQEEGYIKKATNVYVKNIKGVDVDLYDIFDAYNVTDQAIGHALKKLLVPGLRNGGKSKLQDVKEAIFSLQRAATILEAKQETENED